MLMRDLCSGPPYVKACAPTSSPVYVFCFNHLLCHRRSSEVLTGVTYSIISSIKVRFNAPRGDIPSGRRQPDLFTGCGWWWGFSAWLEQSRKPQVSKWRREAESRSFPSSLPAFFIQYYCYHAPLKKRKTKHNCHSMAQTPDAMQSRLLTPSPSTPDRLRKPGMEMESPRLAARQLRFH